ncbi:hypothetical protein JDM601_2775 [Mycolicibacter sinensis]|uniref:Uncharacterized protein n=1 Tax=Mycolicibacter sinensis (strain JDM601) TaxID=875328 RepID=F5YZB1_MYCSD|nr:hypothetical protein JDM601_2775 [Mycolicibacter sinensis]
MLVEDEAINFGASNHWRTVTRGTDIALQVASGQSEIAPSSTLQRTLSLSAELHSD